MMAIKVPRKVYEGLEACRQSGEHNMLDRNGVQHWCYHHEYYEAVSWLEENKSLYGQAVFKGIEPENENEPSI